MIDTYRGQVYFTINERLHLSLCNYVILINTFAQNINKYLKGQIIHTMSIFMTFF